MLPQGAHIQPEIAENKESEFQVCPLGQLEQIGPVPASKFLAMLLCLVVSVRQKLVFDVGQVTVKGELAY